MVIHGVFSFAMEHGEREICECETKVEKFAEKVGRNWRKVEGFSRKVVDFSGALGVACCTSQLTLR